MHVYEYTMLSYVLNQSYYIMTITRNMYSQQICDRSIEKQGHSFFRAILIGKVMRKPWDLPHCHGYKQPETTNQ